MKFLMGLMAALILALPASGTELGEDGLHKTDWMRNTFKDLREDLEEANAEGKRLAVIVEQRGCIYCTKMHEEVFRGRRSAITSAKISLWFSLIYMVIPRLRILTARC